MSREKVRRRGSVFGEDGKTEVIDEVVADFADFGTDAGLAKQVDKFVNDHCSEFYGVDFKEEQNLAWTALHGQFVEMIEIHLESFCKGKKLQMFNPRLDW